MKIVSKLISALSRAATFFQSQPEESLELEPDYYGLSSLTDLVEERKGKRYTLDILTRKILGPEIYSFEQIEEVRYFDRARYGWGKYHACLKIASGPYLCFAQSPSLVAAEALAQTIAWRLKVPFKKQLFDPEAIVGPILKAVELKRIVGMMNLQASEESDQGIRLPVSLYVISESRFDARGELVFGDEVRLYDYCGNWEKVCTPDEIVDLKVASRWRVNESSDSYLLDFKIVLNREFTISFTESAGIIHDDPVSGEADEVYAAMDRMEAAVERIRSRLGLSPPNDANDHEAP